MRPPLRPVRELLVERDLPGDALAELEGQLFGHVRDAIDFGALYQLEQLLWSQLDARAIEDDDGDIAKGLLAEAAVRAVRDPASFFPVRPPPGITEAEARAVERDDACPFCEMEAKNEAYEALPSSRAMAAEEAAEQRALFANEARAWRAQHADVLRRRGLAPR